MRPKISEGRVWDNTRWSDLMAGDNPWNGTREIRSPPERLDLESMAKRTTLWKGKAQIRCATAGPATATSLWS